LDDLVFSSDGIDMSADAVIQFALSRVLAYLWTGLK
jgi:hypothetical protein